MRAVSKEKMLKVTAHAPARLCFAGGGTDVPPFCEEKEGCVVTATINRGFEITISPAEKGVSLDLLNFNKSYYYPLGKKIRINGQFDIIKAAINEVGVNQPARIAVSSNLPAQPLGQPLGLGTSSSLAVVMLGALKAWSESKADKREIADLAIRVERGVLKIPGGFMDQYSASFGGLNFIRFLPGRQIVVEPIKLGLETMRALRKRLVFCFTGSKRREEEQLPELIKTMGDAKAAVSFDSMAKIARKVRTALLKRDLDAFGKWLGPAWELKKRTNPIMTTPQIDRLYDAAIAAGALGGKLSGSGSGGFLSIYCPHGTKKAVRQALESSGGVIYPFAFDFRGLRVQKTSL